MDDFNSTGLEAQSGEQAEVVAPQAESPTEQSGAGQAEVVAPRYNSDFDLVDVGEDDAGEPDGEEQRTAPEDDAARPDGAGRADEVKQQPSGKTLPQSAQENAVYHSMRMRAQREAAEAARAELDAEIAGFGIEDPYNEGKTLSSLNDLRAYSAETQRRKLAAEAQRTGRSVGELEEDAQNRAFLSSLRRASQNAAEQREDPQKAFIDADVLDFVRQYPDMDADSLAALENNPQFRQFCGSRFGREPLAGLYGDYLSFVGDAGAAAVAKATSRSARSTGSGTGGGVVLSPSQKAALDRWNAENPEMAMTAKEFLVR